MQFVKTIDSQYPMTGTPEERPDAMISFPVYSSVDLPAKRAWIQQIPAAMGRTSTGIAKAWDMFSEQWMAALIGQANLIERGGSDGTVAVELKLLNEQAKAARKIEEHKLNVGVSSTEITDANIPEILQSITEETTKIELDRLPTKKSEVFWSKGVKLLFVMPQLMMFSKAMHFDPARSLAFGLILLLGAFGLANVYQLVARPIMECLAALAGKPTVRFGEAPLKLGGIITQLVIFGLGFVAVIACAAALDATVIYQTTKFDRFGQINKAAIPFSTALAIAGSFSGMLGLASLAIARLDRDQADIVRMVEEKIGTMVQSVAPTLEKVRQAEGELNVRKRQEAEVFASARYQWIRLLSAMYFMSKNVPDDQIIRFLMMPHSPIEPSSPTVGCEDNDAPPQRGRGLLGWLRSPKAEA